MSIETIVPGVYIEEDATPAISVSQGRRQYRYLSAPLQRWKINTKVKLSESAVGSILYRCLPRAVQAIPLQ